LIFRGRIIDWERIDEGIVGQGTSSRNAFVFGDKFTHSLGESFALRQSVKSYPLVLLAMIRAPTAHLVTYKAFLGREPSMFLAVIVVFSVYDERIHCYGSTKLRQPG